MKMEGEELRVLERLIVAPAVGVFEPVEAHDGVTEGDDVNEGDAVGHVVVSGERIAVRSRGGSRIGGNPCAQPCRFPASHSRDFGRLRNVPRIARRTPGRAPAQS